MLITKTLHCWTYYDRDGGALLTGPPSRGAIVLDMRNLDELYFCLTTNSLFLEKLGERGGGGGGQGHIQVDPKEGVKRHMPCEF